MPSGIPGLDVNELSDSAGLRQFAQAQKLAPDPSAGWMRRTANGLRSRSYAAVSGMGDGVSGAVQKGLSALGPLADKVPKSIGGGYALAALPGEAEDIYKVGERGTPLDVAAQYGESAGKLGSTALGAEAGAAAGTLVLPGAGTVLGGLLGAAGGYYAGDHAIRGLRQLTGQDSRPVAEQVSSPAPTSAGAPSRPDNWRGKGYDDPRLVNADPTRATLGASRDFTPELNALPRQLPGDLRQGVIHKTIGPGGKVTYSGSNVAAGAQMVDGTGRDITQGGGVSTVPTDGLRSAASSMAAQPAAQTVMQTEPGIIGSVSDRTPEQMRKDALTEMSSIVPQTREMGAAKLQMLNDQDKVAASRYASDQGLRSQMVGADASRYNSDNQLRGTLATAQATGARNSLEMQLKLQGQMATGQAMKQAGGDAGKAAEIMAGWGYDPSTLTALATNKQERAGKDRADAESYAKSESVLPDKNGVPQINDAMLAQNNASLNNITGGAWAGASPAERRQMAPDAVAGLRIVNGINKLRNGGWGNLLNPDSPAMTNLPDLRGASVSRVGGFEGAVSKDISRGDYMVRTRDGQELYLPQDAIDGTSLEFMKKRGATLRLDK